MLKKTIILNFLISACSLIPLAACGDDSSTPSSDDRVEARQYKNLDELPTCTSELANSLVAVGSGYYACIAENWELMDKLVNGVCNIMPCDNENEGNWVYTHSDNKPYQCKSGTWKDPKGNTFDEESFTACYMDALVQDTLSSKDSLKNCAANTEGQIFVVGNDMLFCQSEKWETIANRVISEGDLPACTQNGNTFVMNKISLYQCKDGKWYNKGKPESSSLAASSSSTAKSSSSAVASSSSKIVDDGVTVRGVCAVSARTAEKGKNVIFSLYNLGGTPITYTWNFTLEPISGNEPLLSTSTDMVPIMAFNNAGTVYAEFVVNKGMASESETIACPPVRITGKQVTGCECTLDKEFGFYNEVSGFTATISGCQGGSFFTYTTDEESPVMYAADSGKSVSIQKHFSRKGDTAITVQVFNDEEKLELQCPAFHIIDRLQANCSISTQTDREGNETGYQITMSSLRYAETSGYYIEDYTSFPLHLEGTDGTSIDKDYLCDYSDTYQGKTSCISWKYTPITVPIPSNPISTSYTLYLGGNKMCTVKAPITCSPEKGIMYKGESTKWVVKGLGKYKPESYNWTFVVPGDLLYETDASPVTEGTHDGTISGELVLDRGLETETSLFCSYVTVKSHTITGCSCGYPELLSESNSLAYVPSVTYRWTVSGCETDAKQLTYTWDEGYTADESNPTRATQTFTTDDNYTPYVAVSNEDGVIVDVKCKEGIVKSASVLTYGAHDYALTTIGDQVWMAQNMNYGTKDSWCFNNAEIQCDTYGRLYTAEKAQTVCPQNWHLPTAAEFAELLEFVGGKFEYLLFSGSNTYNFSALPAGMYDATADEFTDEQYVTGWWLKPEPTEGGEKPVYQIYGKKTQGDQEAGFFTPESANDGFSVRCVRD